MSMYNNHVNLLKGAKPGQPWAVDKATTKKSGEGTITAGTVIHLDPAADANPSWKRGLPTPTATSAPVPFIAWLNDTDFDAVGDSGNIVGAPESGTTQQPVITGMCLAQPSEIETPNFQAGSYSPGDLLTCTAAGVVKPATGSADEIVIGVVTDGVLESPYDSTQDVLRFISTFQIMLNTTLGA